MGLRKAFDAASPQKDLDFAIPYRAGYRDCYIKAGGDNAGRYVAPYYPAQVDAARKAGFEHIGHYWVPGGDPVSAANYFTANLRNFHKPSDFVILDNETLDSGHAYDDQEADLWVARVMQNLGIPAKQVFVYFGAAFLRSQLWPRLEKRGVQVIVAVYGPNDGTRHSDPEMGGRFGNVWAGHQYTSIGRIPGYGNPLDLDVFQSAAFSWSTVPTAKTLPRTARTVFLRDSHSKAIYSVGPDPHTLHHLTPAQWAVWRGKGFHFTDVDPTALTGYRVVPAS